MKQQGFSMIGLMAVVAIIAVLALVAMPIYNHYIETTKVSNAVPSVGNYKQGVASCFLENDTLEGCNAGESGIPEGLDNDGRVLNLDVFEGNITMQVDAENHTTDTSPIELAYATDPETTPTDASLDWTLLCNDYVGNGSRLMDSCKGNTDGEDNDLVWEPTTESYTDWENTTSGNYSAWQPPVSNQTSDFEQTRTFEQEQERERIVQERNRLDGTVREVERITETRTLTDTEKRMVSVDVQTGSESSNWSDVGGLYECSDWTPARDTAYEDEQITQTRECSQDQEKVIEYTADGDVISTLNQDRTLTNVDDGREVSGTEPLWVDTSDNVNDWQWTESRQYTSDWSPAVDSQTSSFEQSRDYERDRERTIETREQNQRTDEIRIVSTSTETNTQTGTETRTVSVGVSGSSSITDTKLNCGTWSPARSTKPEGETFTQTASCDRRIETTRLYAVNGSQIATDETYQLESYTAERQRTGTKSMKECKYSGRHSGNVSWVYAARVGLMETEYEFKWGNQFYKYVYVDNRSGGSHPVPDPIVHDGYKYTRGERMETGGRYEICREPN